MSDGFTFKENLPSKSVIAPVVVPLINTLTSFICDDLSFEESFKSFKDATDSETKKRLKTADDLKKERRAKAFGSDEKPDSGEAAAEEA